ncbi:hypothetical protein [Diaphorobacter sp.]|uniref:hypothetical protein n=1 Tax=Diaphorobacter sp. TaxID=1934310 RepID=UPI003D0B874A
MQTMTNNAARVAAQAKPCLKGRDNVPAPKANPTFRQVVVNGQGFLVPLGADPAFPSTAEAEDVFDQIALYGQDGYLLRRNTDTACPAAAKASQLALQAQDETESLRTVLSACRAVAAMAAVLSDPGAMISMEALGELLHLHNDAMATRIDSLEEMIEAASKGVADRPMGDTARSVAFDARDFVCHLRTAQLAFGAIACMVPSSTDTLSGEDLSAAISLVIDAMAARTVAMDEQLDALYAALARTTTTRGQP